MTKTLRSQQLHTRLSSCISFPQKVLPARAAWWFHLALLQLSQSYFKRDTMLRLRLQVPNVLRSSVAKTLISNKNKTGKGHTSSQLRRLVWAVVLYAATIWALAITCLHPQTSGQLPSLLEFAFFLYSKGRSGWVLSTKNFTTAFCAHRIIQLRSLPRRELCERGPKIKIEENLC